MAPNKRFPIGFRAKIKYSNLHDVPEGTEFEIVRIEHYPFDYMVKFIGKEFEKLNSQGPFIRESDIILTRTAKVLYGE